jgi:hypothetical protein
MSNRNLKVLVPTFKVKKKSKAIPVTGREGHIGV